MKNFSCKLKKLPCDVFLVPHGSLFWIAEEDRTARPKSKSVHRPKCSHKDFQTSRSKDFKVKLKEQQEQKRKSKFCKCSQSSTSLLCGHTLKRGTLNQWFHLWRIASI